MSKIIHCGREFDSYWDYQIYLGQEQLKLECPQYGCKPGELQWKWRGLASGNTPLPPFNYIEVELAILDALITEGCVPAWRGDGLSCAAQIPEYIYRKQQEKIDSLQKEVDYLKSLLV